MHNLLLITDVTRLRKIFARVTEDKNIRLRVVNNLEKGGEEIATETPDVVFVQTHLSGLSAEILIMHLKKQLGVKHTRFVLLAAPGRTNPSILELFQGWLDSSLEDNQLLSELQQLLGTLLSEPKKNEQAPLVEQIDSEPLLPQAVSSAESTALLGHDRSPEENEIRAGLQLPAAPPLSSDDSLVDQGITYPPRQRLKVYSEFNSSFDSAVGSTAEPETIEQAGPTPAFGWDGEEVDTAETKPRRSQRGTFLLWLAPVVVAVVLLTYFQQQRSTQKPEPVAQKSAPVAIPKPAAPPAAEPLPTPEPTEQVKGAVVTATNKPDTAATKDLDKNSDRAVLKAISEKPENKTPAVTKSVSAPLTVLPQFVPLDGLVKQYGIDNPGWELYMGKVTEFRVLRKGKTIKAIQVIDRGWRGVSEKFMQRAFLQVTGNKPVFSKLTSEKKDGYEIQRGSIADTIKVVYYREEQGGKLRAFVLTWH